MNSFVSRNLPPIIGVASLYAVQFISFLEGRGLEAIPFPILVISSAFFLGIFCGGFLLSKYTGKGGLALLAGTAFVSGILWAVALLFDSGTACFFACFLGAMPFPMLLRCVIFRSDSPGLHLGTALAFGDFFWLFLLFLSSPPSPMFIAGILLALQWIGGTAAIFCLRSEKKEEAKENILIPSDGLARESLIYLSLTALVFFLINVFVDIAFYRMHDASFPIPVEVHLYIWLVYPLTGLYIDKHGAGIRLFLSCLGVTLLAPMVIAVTEGTALYWGIYSVALSARAAAMLYLFLVFAHCSKMFRHKDLVIAIPYLAMLGVFGFACLFTELFPGTIYITFAGLFLAASFSYLSSRVQYALTLSGILLQKTEEKKPAVPVYRTELLAQFSDKYGISAREQDVLSLIVAGEDTAAICAHLHLSENTIKTHVRQLLRKTETRNRVALAALFFNEPDQNSETAASQKNEKV